ncbi:CGNR zinc finger domain-containing protein [Luedemannella helvata]|uniref:Zinc finger CGNR domain-containing protein n=1 Tax=Luedemannella helvata TaxID=349315 RepID=A0ABP4X8N8_9ACTN
MASIDIDGLAVPLCVGGDPALDFCNTRAGWGAVGPKEYLHTHAHLCVWAGHAGLLTPERVDAARRAGARHPAAADAVRRRALALREALYGVLVEKGEQDAAWRVLDAEARRAAAVAHLAPGRPASWQLTGASDVELPLLVVAWHAARLLTSEAAATVRACPGSGCGWLFADPRGRRRWCSMAWCGNRHKVRAHAARRRSAH